MKTFEEVTKESTCQKRITICEIINEEGFLLARESNRCDPEGGTCHRIGLVQTKENYDLNSHCNWTHAEIMTIRALPEGSKPYQAIIYGHQFFCDNCENELRKVGVTVFEQRTRYPKTA